MENKENFPKDNAPSEEVGEPLGYIEGKDGTAIPYYSVEDRIKKMQDIKENQD